MADTRGSGPRAPTGVGVRLSPWSLQAGRARPTLIRSACPVRVRGLQLPAEYANWQSGQVESLATLWVRLPPRSLHGLLVQREDAGVASRRLGFDSPAVHSQSRSQSVA